MLIRIELPRDRDYCGRLSVLDEAGKVRFGPVWCAGRANDAAAARHGNDGRSCLLPYGDTPTGLYRLRRIISMREASDRALRQLGRFGAVSLGATGGPALMADSVGRFEIWIHGGCAAPDGRLCNTNGSVRLADPDFFGFVNVVKGREGAACEIAETGRVLDAPSVRVDEPFDEGDPPSLDDAPAKPAWPIPLEPARPLHTIFFGEYDGGGSADASSDSASSGGDSAASEGSTIGGTDTAWQDTSDPIANEEMVTKAAEIPDSGVAGSVDQSADDRDRSRPQGGFGQTVIAFFRSLFRDTTVSQDMRDVDGREPVAEVDMAAAIAAKFDAASTRKFAQLPNAARAALAGLAQAYGAGLDTTLPEFWSAATAGRWQAAVQALLRVRDGRGIARTRAADLLQGAINSGALR